jgi:alpha-tubulin suppressor-like RCC1 family protein
VGELGDGSGISYPKGITRRVAGLDRVTRIAAGGQQSLALRDDGTVWAWGRDRYTASGAFEPAAVAGLTDARAIGAGRYHLRRCSATAPFAPGRERPKPARACAVHRRRHGQDDG